MKTIEEIVSDVENEYQMGGLFSGIHEDFVREVAKRYAQQVLDIAIKVCEDQDVFDGVYYYPDTDKLRNLELK